MFVVCSASADQCLLIVVVVVVVVVVVLVVLLVSKFKKVVKNSILDKS